MIFSSFCIYREIDYICMTMSRRDDLSIGRRRTPTLWERSVRIVRIAVLMWAVCVLVRLHVYAYDIPFVPPVYNYTTAMYGGGNQNWAVAQGADGVIYIGNNNGLLRFDGVNWELHRLPNHLSVKSLFVDTTVTPERVYIGSFEEFGYFAADAARRLTYHSLKPLVKDYPFRNDEVWTIRKIGAVVYFQSFSSYFAYRPAEGSIRYARPYPAPLYFFEAGGALLSQWIDDDFYRLDEAGKTERLFGREEVGDDDIVSVLPFGREWLLVSSQHGFFAFDSETRAVRPWPTDIDAELRTAIVNRAVCTHDSIYIVGTLNKGLFAVGRDGRKRWHLHRQNGLNNNTVLGLFVDRDHHVWAVLDNGISLIHARSGLSFFQPEGIQLGLVEDMLFYDNKLYLATNQGVYKSSGGDGRMERLPGFDTQSWFIRSFDGQIITGNNRGTSFIYNDQNIPVATSTGGMDIRQARLYEQDVLIESTYTYLSVYRRNKAGHWMFDRQIDGFYDLIHHLETDHTGNIWAGHMYKGVYRLRLNDSLNAVAETTYFPHLHPADSTPAHIRVMKLRGRIVFSDGRHFYTYDDIGRRIILYEQLNTQLRGLEDVNRVAAINDSLYWFVCDDAYALVGLRDNIYRLREKIPFAVLNHPPNSGRGNVHVTSDGVSYLCLDGGLARYMPPSGVSYAPPSLRLHAVSAYNRRSDERQYLSVDAPPAPIDYAFNHLTFAFQYPDFSRKAFRIECLLAPYDTRWMATDDHRRIEYGYLPAGEYTLQSRVLNNLGEELATLTYSFRIRNPWYRTATACVGYLFFGILLMLFLIRLYTCRVMRKRSELFDQQEKERMAQLDRQEKLITTLRNERLEADLIYKGKELAGAAMSIINQKEFLNKLKHEIQAVILQGKMNKNEGRKLLALIDGNLSDEDDWGLFQENFDLIHENFFRRLQEKYPALTPTDLKLCALLRLNYSSKEIANMLNLTVRGAEAARYRLRKKLNLSEEVNLVSFMIDFK